jgi:hypothetical protein
MMEGYRPHGYPAAIHARCLLAEVDPTEILDGWSYEVLHHGMFRRNVTGWIQLKVVRYRNKSCVFTRTVVVSAIWLDASQNKVACCDRVAGKMNPAFQNAVGHPYRF